jgi:hypothetical protein
MEPFEIVAYEWPWAPGEGAYVTDGRSLFRLERAEHDAAGGPLLVLEDCRTLERVLCPPRALIGRGLRSVAHVRAVGDLDASR